MVLFWHKSLHFTAPHFKSDQMWLKNYHLASLVQTRDILSESHVHKHHQIADLCCYLSEFACTASFSNNLQCQDMCDDHRSEEERNVREVFLQDLAQSTSLVLLLLDILQLWRFQLTHFPLDCVIRAKLMKPNCLKNVTIQLLNLKCFLYHRVIKFLSSDSNNKKRIFLILYQ